MSIDAFIRQATEYVEEEDLFARGARFTREIGRTHPASVRRVRELVLWVQSGELDTGETQRLVDAGDESGGHIVRRRRRLGDPEPAARLVHQGDVGERPADVEGDRVPHDRRPLSA